MPETTWTPPALTPEQEAAREWRDHWPWRKALALPPLPPAGWDTQTFVRLATESWGTAVVYRDDVPVSVPLIRDPISESLIGMLPVPSPRVTVTYSTQQHAETGQPYTRIDVTTGGPDA
jgi:hypothetical protein